MLTIFRRGGPAEQEPWVAKCGTCKSIVGVHGHDLAPNNLVVVSTRDGDSCHTKCPNCETPIVLKPISSGAGSMVLEELPKDDAEKLRNIKSTVS